MSNHENQISDVERPIRLVANRPRQCMPISLGKVLSLLCDVDPLHKVSMLPQRIAELQSIEELTLNDSHRKPLAGPESNCKVDCTFSQGTAESQQPRHPYLHQQEI
jgi:hypothetical protein